MELGSLAARVFQFAPNGSVARKIRDCRDLRVSRLWWSCRLSRDSKEETRKKGRRDPPIGREQKEKPGGKVEKEMGEEEKERNLSAGIRGRGDSKLRERERERGSGRRTFNSRDVYFRRT